MKKRELINGIIDLEWQQFQLVNNDGGRSACQDNEVEFRLNRMSQFLTWPQEILESYREDLLLAQANDKNLLFVKYAFMMKDTAPLQFEGLKPYLPDISEQRLASIAEAVNVHIAWACEHAKKNPMLAGLGRPIRKEQALPGQTSIETYQWGELCSYGAHTEQLYHDFVLKCRDEGRNLAEETRSNLQALRRQRSCDIGEASTCMACSAIEQ